MKMNTKKREQEVKIHILHFWDNIRLQYKKMFIIFMAERGISRNNLYEKMQYRLVGVKPVLLEGIYKYVTLFEEKYGEEIYRKELDRGRKSRKPVSCGLEEMA